MGKKARKKTSRAAAARAGELRSTGGSVRGGPPPGVPATAKMAAANRVRAWKHGKYAKVVDELEVRSQEVGRVLRADAPEIIQRYSDYYQSGNPDDIAPIDVTQIAEGEIRRREIADQITKDGVAIHEAVLGSDGREIGTRIRAHPLLEHERWIREQVGATAADKLMTRKSRGDMATNAVIAAAVARDAAVRQADKSGLQLPDREALKARP